MRDARTDERPNDEEALELLVARPLRNAIAYVPNWTQSVVRTGAMPKPGGIPWVLASRAALCAETCRLLRILMDDGDAEDLDGFAQQGASHWERCIDYQIDNA